MLTQKPDAMNLITVCNKQERREKKHEEETESGFRVA